MDIKLSIKDNSSRKQSNSNLLRVLTKRQSESITTVPNNDWPGKFMPNFANITLPSKSRAFKSLTQQHKHDSSRTLTSYKTRQSMRQQIQSVKCIRNIPVAKMSSISLSIKPSTNNCTITNKIQTNTRFHSNKYAKNSKILKIVDD